jgi:hypothetical protein
MNGFFGFLFFFSLAALPDRFNMKEISEFYRKLEAQDVKVKLFRGKGLGVEVQTKKNPGDIVLCTKNDMIITPFDKYELSEVTSELDEKTRMKIRMLYLKFMSKENDFFTNYTKTLSNQFFHYGAWNDYQKSLLFNLTLDEFDYEDPDGKEEYEIIKSCLKDVQGIPSEMLEYESFLWAHYVVRSRNYAFTVDGKKSSAIIPLLDIVNHYYDDKKYIGQGFFNFTEDKVCLVTYWPLEPGDEFLYQYSSVNALSYLLYYNIIVQNSPFDFIIYEYRGPIGIGSTGDNYFKFHGDSINIQFFSILKMMSGSSFTLKETIQETWISNKSSDHFAIIDSLLLYHHFLNRYLNSWKIGLRAIRREFKGEDYISQRIIEYAISTRITALNHKRALDQSILFTLHSKLLS